MAKGNGLGVTIDLDDEGGTPVDISNDVTSWSADTPIAQQDVTGQNKSAHERIQLLQDFSATLNGVWNPDLSHTALADLTGVRTLDITTVTSEVLSAEALLTAYALSRGAGGELTWSTTANNADGELPTWA